MKKIAFNALTGNDNTTQKHDYLNHFEKPTKARQMSLGKKGETYDDIVNKLIDFWKKRKK